MVLATSGYLNRRCRSVEEVEAEQAQPLTVGELRGRLDYLMNYGGVPGDTRIVLWDEAGDLPELRATQVETPRVSARGDRYVRIVVEKD